MKTKTIGPLVILLALFAGNINAAPAGTAFSYQGRLTDGTAIANGHYDMQFKLFDAVSDGVQIAATATIAPVVVSNGLFTVLLDYGGSSFPGDARWLEIGVRTNGSVDPYVTLSPRQALTPTPYAIFAAAAPVSDGAVTTTKILDGTILGADIAPNTVGSSQLGDSIELGSVAANGRLDVYRTAANTPAISLIGSDSRISVNGSDGLEQIRLWGPSFGEVILHNSLAANNVGVLLSANGASGGRLTLNNTNGNARALLSGANAGGSLTLYQADGQTGLFADGDNLGSGLLQLRNTNGNTRISLYGQSPDTTGGEISVLASNGTETVELIGQNSSLTGGKITLRQDSGVIGAVLVAEFGADGEGSAFELNQSSGGLGLRLEGDYFNGGRATFLNARTNVTVDIMGNGDSLGAGSGGGLMILGNTNGSTRVMLGGMGANGGGELNLRDTSGTETLELLGAYTSNLGAIMRLKQSDGTIGVELYSETSVGDGGLVSIKNAAGSERLELDGDDGDGAPVVRLRNTNGVTTVMLDGDVTGKGRVTTEELVITTASTSLLAGATLTPSTGFVRVAGSGGAVTLNATTAIASGVSGAILILEGTSAVNTVTIPDNANTRLAAARVLGLNDTLMLIFNGSDWVEVSYTAN